MALTEESIKELFKAEAEAKEELEYYEELHIQADEKWSAIHKRLFQGSVEDCRAVLAYIHKHKDQYSVREYDYMVMSLEGWIEAEPERRKVELAINERGE